MGLKQLTVTQYDGTSGSTEEAVTYRRTTAAVGSAEQRVAIGDMTDGGGATGTIQLSDSLPEGAIAIGAKVDVETAFAGTSNTDSILMGLGDGSDVDRFGDAVDLETAGIVAEDVVGEAAISSDTDVTLTVTEATSASGTLDNAAAVDNGDGTVNIPITAHGLTAGRRVTLASTTNYNNTYEVVAVPDADTITITETYASETFAGSETWSAEATFGVISAGQMVVSVVYIEI